MTVNIAHSCTRCYTGITFLSLYNFWLFLDVMTVLFVCLVFFIHNYYQTVSRFAQAPQVTSVRCLSHLSDDRRYNLYSLPLCVPSLQVAPVAAAYMLSWSLPWPASEDLHHLSSTLNTRFHISLCFLYDSLISMEHISKECLQKEGFRGNLFEILLVVPNCLDSMSALHWQPGSLWNSGLEILFSEFRRHCCCHWVSRTALRD